MRTQIIFFLLLLTLGISSPVWAVPSQTMSITPACTAGTTITCSDNTTRMNNVSTPFNAHTHNDIISTTSNTFTFGDGLTGSKSLAISNNFTTSPSLRFNGAIWQFSNDASTFLGNLGSSASLTANSFLYPTAAQTVTSTAAATNGQLLIGSTGAAPVLAALTAGTNVTVTNAAGSITVNALETGTWSAPSRLKDTVYQNTSGKKRRVAIVIELGNGNNQGRFQVDTANPPTVNIITPIGPQATTGAITDWEIYAEVPNNSYYRLVTVTGTIGISTWYELDE